MDLRMIKTRRDIRNALLDLLDDNRSFESITVSQIARQAGIPGSESYVDAFPAFRCSNNRI